MKGRRLSDEERVLCARGCGRQRVYRVYCRECNVQAAREWREANRERLNEYARMRASSSPEQHAERLAAYRDKYPDGRRKRKFEFRPHSVRERRAYVLLREYGITQEQYDELLSAQDGGCAICGATASGDPRRPALHVDHDHRTSLVRGLLCMRCNVAIGALRDDVDLIDKAALYVRKSVV